MFKFLKDKLKNALGKFSKDVEKDAIIEKKETIITEKPPEKKIEIVQEKKGFFSRIFGKKETEDTITEKEDLIEELEEPSEKEIIVDKKIEVPEYKPHEHDDKHPHEKHGHIHDIKHEILDIKIKATEQAKPELKTETKTIKTEIKAEPIKPEIKPPQLTPEKKGFFTKITETFTKFNLSESRFEELFWELEVVLLENNVAVEVIDKIKQDMKKELMSGKVNRSGVDELIAKTLKNSIIELFDVEHIDLLDRIKHKKPYIIAVIGVNGSGKTTSIAKLTKKMQDNGLSVVLAASDTFRAAAIQQLEEHAKKLNVKIIKHDYHSDPAAVAFDAIKYADAHSIDVVMIDTAGRLHSNTNLMEELKKVVRVCKPDIKIFVGESITGNDCVEQAKEFDKAVGIDAIILAKADVDEKGGAAISVSYVTQKPILYLGVGQNYSDLKEFDPKLIIEGLEL